MKRNTFRFEYIYTGFKSFSGQNKVNSSIKDESFIIDIKR